MPYSNILDEKDDQKSPHSGMQENRIKNLRKLNTVPDADYSFAKLGKSCHSSLRCVCLVLFTIDVWIISLRSQVIQTIRTHDRLHCEVDDMTKAWHMLHFTLEIPSDFEQWTES